MMMVMVKMRMRMRMLGLDEMGGKDGDFLETKGFFCNERGRF